MSQTDKPAEAAVQLQPARLRDAGAIYRLERLCFKQDAWPWFDIVAVLLFPETIRIKAVVDNQIVGFVVGDRRRGAGLGWIASIGVHPHFRGRGIGRRMLDACEDALGMPRVRLTLRRSNEVAMNLYTSTGYAPVDTWKRYYRDGEDGIVMEKRRTMSPSN